MIAGTLLFLLSAAGVTGILMSAFRLTAASDASNDPTTGSNAQLTEASLLRSREKKLAAREKELAIKEKKVSDRQAEIDHRTKQGARSPAATVKEATPPVSGPKPPLDAGKPNDAATPPVENPAPEHKQRNKLLTDLDARRKEILAAAEEESKQNEVDRERLGQYEAQLRQNPRFGDPFDRQAVAQFNDFLREKKRLLAKIQKFKDDLEEKWVALEQERRRILVQFPEPGDPALVEYKKLLYTKDELDRTRAYEKEHASPRVVADSYLTVLEQKGVLRGSSYIGLFKKPKEENSYAVCYTASSINGRAVNRQLVHVYAFKDPSGYWQVSAFSPDGVHVMLGGPPTGYVRAKEPPDSIAGS